MKPFICILTILAFPAAAAAGDNPFDLAASLEKQEIAPDPAAAQKQSEERGLPESGESLPLMEYLYRYSELDMGMLLTKFAESMKIKNDFGFFLRWGVGISDHMSINLAYRYYGFSNSGGPYSGDETVTIRGLIVGLGYRRPLTGEIAFTANGGLGMLDWNSNKESSSRGLVLSVEGGLTFKLHEALRLRMGPVIDFASAAIHDSSGNAMNLSWLLGLEVGG